jgi:multiple sugar transport system substrate-binding protein
MSKGEILNHSTAAALSDIFKTIRGDIKMVDNKKALGLSRRNFLKYSSVAAAATVGGLSLTTPRRSYAQLSKTHLVYVWPFAAAQSIQEDIINLFNEQSNTIEVELQIVPQDNVLPALTTAFSGGAGPDVLAMSPAWLTQFAAAGWLENLEDRLASTDLEEKILPVGIIQGRMYQNTAYMLGSVVDTYPLFYNKQHFADAGLTEPPATLEDFREYANLLTDAANNRYGYFQLAGNAWGFQSWSTWMINHGGIGAANTLYEEDGTCIFRRPEHIAGLEEWMALYQEDQVTPLASISSNFNDASNAFNAGQVSMAFGFLGYIRNFTEGMGRENFGVAITPSGPAGQFVHWAANGYCIGSGSPYKDEAWEFTQFLLTPEINGMLNEAWGAIPSIREALNFEYLQDPVFAAPIEMAQMEDVFVHTPRQYPEWARFFQNYGPEQIQSALLGQQSAADFASNVSDSLEEMRAANEPA